jgi:hypothetical protein
LFLKHCLSASINTYWVDLFSWTPNTKPERELQQ